MIVLLVHKVGRFFTWPAGVCNDVLLVFGDAIESDHFQFHTWHVSPSAIENKLPATLCESEED
jgi:hypothetical protein